MSQAIGIFGGTFDPIHQGHLKPVKAAAQQIGLDKVYLLPCHIPPHKGAPEVSSAQRREMVALVCGEDRLFELDDRELNADVPSYTVNTLRQYRLEHPDSPLMFFMGMDSFNSFHRWVQWQEITDLAHLVVCLRGHHQPDWNDDIQTLLKQRRTERPKELHRQPAGLIYLADTPELTLASTDLRRHLRQGQADSSEIPEAVLNYIQQHGLYRS
ncbi:Nicotinate-nucleotide adenylyltransferase [Saliniradius amylolyticus]|uniref:Probable nicotinate-nucleotide adenylyltransferase n=1 Tax=Saliniradius amylolyticus TaxID=2183582 RepID=A0A2S2E1C6_9ALTE|nr:nicotinate-nucleotide adenylyltransferase [Saliniradius amylolyticus]AWL11451.1 Nicotinate-nucleotide adenylyltransferase [Saliniradius amylolyticus]